MTDTGKIVAGKRVLVVEDELMIRMLLEGMLTDLGHTVAAEAGGIDEAVALAKKETFDVAVLDVNLNGHPVTPVVEILVERGVPFLFASGYGLRRAGSLSRNPDLAKAVSSRCAGAGDRSRGFPRSKLNPVSEQLRKPRHCRLVGDVDTKRRDRDAALVKRRNVRTVLRLKRV